MEDIEDLSKMKVADLKKHLKGKGLPVTGNKTELVERLQQAMQSEDNPTVLEPSSGVDDEEFDEEEILGGEELDDSKITQEEEAEALAGNLKVKEDALLMTESQPEKKKISLKRSEPSLSSTTTTATTETETATQEETVTSNSNSSTNLSNDKENSIANVEEPKHKVIKLSGTTTENVIEARSKKFATVASDGSEESRKLARATRFGIDASLSSSPSVKKGVGASKLSMEVGDTSLDKLKMRAERFGVVTAKTLTKVEEIEKRKQRQNRFGSGESEKSDKKSEDTDESAKKTQNGTKIAITAPENEDDAKKKRAERFAAAAAAEAAAATATAAE